ncbi:MAG TPA: dihydrodipicolinate synthase family protein [Bryobacteraceae bacterium]|nr:dihydrodipicolinate synthase family protein [Bryobacteraceae bacterium]
MIYPAAITPRRADEVAIDIAAALELMDFLESHGVDGIALFGSTGEFLHFTPEDRTRLAAMVAKRCRVPVLVNASHSTLDGSIAIAQQALDAGAAGVLIMPPYYYRYSQDSIRAYMLEFAAQVKGPLYLYNIPPFTSDLKISTSLDLLARHAFDGIKDSSGRWEDFVELQRASAKVFVGADTMYSRAARAGAMGAISGVASVVPELLVAIDRAARAGNDTSALDARLADFIDRAMAFPFPIALREAAAVRGIRTGPHASPLGRDECQRLEEFRTWFRAWLAGGGPPGPHAIP